VRTTSGGIRIAKELRDQKDRHLLLTNS